jgi:hypothetical protein
VCFGLLRFGFDLALICFDLLWFRFDIALLCSGTALECSGNALELQRRSSGAAQLQLMNCTLSRNGA